MLFTLSITLQWPVVLPASGQQFHVRPVNFERRCGHVEAAYHLRQCGDTARDGDSDGIPCEKNCGNTKAVMNKKLSEGR